MKVLFIWFIICSSQVYCLAGFSHQIYQFLLGENCFYMRHNLKIVFIWLK